MIAIEKNDRERYQISVDQHGDGQFVNVRLWWREDAECGWPWKPSRKGFTVPLHLWDQFKAGINELEVPASPEESAEFNHS